MINAGKQINSMSFKLDGKYYKGRIEEARKGYWKRPEIFTKYSFEEYVNMLFVEIKKPKFEIKQEIIDLCAKTMEPPALVKLTYLINKL